MFRQSRVLAIAAVSASVAAATAIVALSGSASAAAGCAVNYKIASEWPGGFVAEVTMRNLGDPLTGWRVTWSYTGGQRVSSAWNATVTQEGTGVTAVNVAHNGAVASNGDLSFGLQGSWTGSNLIPSGFALNGVACTGGIGKNTPPPWPTATPPATAVPTPAVSPTMPPTGCPASGNITYTLNRASNPTTDQTAAYNLITTAMNQAVTVYNCQTNLTKALRVSYEPSVATADGNINGSIRFGARSSMQRITAMHEIAHTLGVGTSAAWAPRLSNKVWTGSAATAELRTLTGDPAAVLHGDSQHFWPYGLNYTTEVKSDQDLVYHCRIVVALRRDMGL